MQSKVLQMLVPEGDPNGIKIIEMPGWSGKCFIVPRQNLKKLRERAEINQPGLYFLFGSDEPSTEEWAYVGESEKFYSRITNHDSNKDFWSVAIIFTGALNRALVKYLECKATTMAYEAERMNLQNKIKLQENTLSEFDKVTAEEYFENVQFILSVINYKVFEKIAESISDEKIYYIKADKADAKAQLLKDGSLNVLKGSLARIKETDSFFGWSKTSREKFVKEGIFIENSNNGSYVFTKDVLFKSPTAAAAAVTGRPINGWTAWKDKKGNTLDENVRK